MLTSFPRISSRRFGFVALILLLALATGALPSTDARAQGNSRTFPETGKTIGGAFLQYWISHGGLAQQGYPITEEIQETSATDGKIYTVQYMERAVFEHHPENQAPYNVLLALLGVFRYQQKYPQGAPDQIPNNEPNARTFPETGKRLGGLFRTYWESHGGLAQQGYPISDEFNEVSDLDGKTYKVQYFERAVFEHHPENQPPYNVLLSQLGTFRQRSKYGTLSHQLNGSSNQTTAPFALKAGLAVFQSVRTANGGYFYIDLLDSNGQQLSTIASGSIPLDIADAVYIPTDGLYLLQIQADRGWTVNIWQPQASYTPPPATQRWSGRYAQVTPLFSLKAGQATFHAISANSQAQFTVYLYNQNGQYVEAIVNTPGAADQSIAITIPADGVYLIKVQSDGDWTVEVQQ
jgi:hypothetical protein